MFGLDRTAVAGFEDSPDDSALKIDCLWPGKLLIEMKSRGNGTHKAFEQALKYYSLLPSSKLPRFILACDFEYWYLKDKSDNSYYYFDIYNLVDHIGLFGFMTDKPQRPYSNPVNNNVSEILGSVYEELEKNNYPSYQARHFLTRLVFCLFGDDTNVFADNNKFQEYIRNTSEDGSELGHSLSYLFSILNTPKDKRPTTTGSDVMSWPYINGALFEGQIDFPVFDAESRRLIIEAGEPDWSKVSPAIFGNLFQTVMDQESRHELGAHYTSEENILKVIRPLFLDSFSNELDDISAMDNVDSKNNKLIQF